MKFELSPGRRYAVPRAMYTDASAAGRGAAAAPVASERSWTRCSMRRRSVVRLAAPFTLRTRGSRLCGYVISWGSDPAVVVAKYGQAMAQGIDRGNGTCRQTGRAHHFPRRLSQSAAVGSVAYRPERQEVLDCDLAAEIFARGLYQEAATYCHTAQDYVTRDLFEKLMADEEHHIDFLETQLDLVGKLGL
jgi:Ferritin-like domain